jgi:hypothetical protein
MRGLYGYTREFTKSREEMEATAIERAAQTVRSVFAVLDRSGHPSEDSAGLLSIAHAAYREALEVVEMECEKVPSGEMGGLAGEYVPVALSHARMARARANLRAVPGAYASAMAATAEANGAQAAWRSVMGVSSEVHPDGTPCACDPGCSCHPPTRNEDPIVTGERGSWHLDSCPVSPKNRGKGAP